MHSTHRNSNTKPSRIRWSPAITFNSVDKREGDISSVRKSALDVQVDRAFEMIHRDYNGNIKAYFEKLREKAAE